MDELIQIFNAIPEQGIPWLMNPSERVAVLGILEILKPKKTLEIGCRFAGCTSYLSKYSEQVTTIDMDPKAIEASKQFSNVFGINACSVDAMKTLIEKKESFDLIIIDGDHSEVGAQKDLDLAIKLGRYIILHDTFNPDCRLGYMKALKNKDIFCELDFILGGKQEDGYWGGLGIVIPNVKKEGLKIKNSQTDYFKIVMASDKYVNQV